MVVFLKDQGIFSDSHQSKQLERKNTEWADMILVMEKEQGYMIERMWTMAKKKIAPLGGYISDAGPPDDISDPAGKSPYHYRLVQSQITLAVQGLADYLEKDRVKAPHAQD
jgi:protein-tyrosine-phosphatase